MRVDKREFTREFPQLEKHAELSHLLRVSPAF